MFVDLAERDAARARDRAIVRRGAGERERHRLDQAGHVIGRHRAKFSGRRLPATTRSPAATTPRPCAGRWTAIACRAAGRAARPIALCVMSGRRSMKSFASPDFSMVSRSLRRQRIDAAAFEAVMRDHGLAAHHLAVMQQRDALERLSGETLAENIRPLNSETAIGRTQRRYLDLLFLESVSPSAIGAELRPARAAEREHGRVRRIGDLFSVRPDETSAHRHRSIRSSDDAALNTTPARSSRRSQARRNGEDFMSFGNTRPLVPMKVGWPSASLNARRSSGEKAVIAARRCVRRFAVTRRESARIHRYA